MWFRAIGFLFSAAAAFGQQPYLTEPAVAPDRAEIAFVSGGDIWTAPLAGGEAHLLVSHPATESRPMYSPDGGRLAFVSTRTGNGDVYVLNLASGALQRITFDDAAEVLDGWSRDGRWLYFSSAAQDISGMSDVYRVSAGGGMPMPVSADRYVSEFFSAPSPKGGVLAITARGITSAQWWRHGHSHLDESEIWLETMGASPTYEKLAGGDYKCVWPMWSADGARVYFMSDAGGAENIWEKPVKGGAARQVTEFKDGRVLWPAISYDGRTIVFERDFRVWKLETGSGKAAPVGIALRGAPAGPAVTHLTLTSGFRDLALSPDGRKIAFAAHGEVFAAGAKDGGQAARVTRTAANENGIAWSPDSKRVAYVSDRDGRYQVYLYDFASGQETRASDGAGADTAPVFSPDGKLLSFVRDAKELRVYDLEAKQSRALAAGYFGRPPMASNRFCAWSPDSKWVAYSNPGERGFRNVWVVPAAGGEPRQVSFLSNTNGGAVAWSPDGTYLLFDTTQRTEDNRIARVDLVPRAPRFREDRFRDLFHETAAQPRPGGAGGAGGAGAAKAAEAKPVTIVFEGIRERLSVLPIGLDARLERISADGKTLLVSATAARQENLYTYPLDELAAEPAVARQATSTAVGKSDAQFSPDGKEIFYLEQGRVMTAAVETRAAKPVAVTAEMDVDFAREKNEVFAEAWAYLNDNFFDAKFHGVDWNAQRARFAPLVEGARTADELRRVIGLMIGEMNASHMGIAAPPADGSAAGAVGKLGLRFDAAEYWASGRFKVREVIPLGPAALAGGIKAGDSVTAIDGVTLTAAANIDELLDHKVNRRVTLTVGDREIAVRPISTAAEKDLVYRQWVDAQRAYVARASGGRLGYVHIRDMSAEALEQLYRDLDTENQGREGVVVDVRNNNGGFVNVYAIDVLARRSYLQMTPRDRVTAPARIVLGQRALERPTILVTNRHSLSDAEDFTEGYRALKLGKVVGEPTAGWIIYTSNTQLIDGSVVRLPQTRVTTAEGAAMELSPRPVDIAVDKPVGEGAAGKDSQLDAAVMELLKEIDAKK
jgi:Tol biopolymer transport system component/C-terminal processing protease CtpA/Prc